MAEKKHSTKFIDLTGQRFGRLTVVERVQNSGTRAQWMCLCDCGNTRVVVGKGLRNGHVKSCGCLKKEIARVISRTHGQKGTSMYSVWTNMNTRCNNQRSDRFADYGGRGIRVCERWRVFENFLADMGERPAGMTLDRKDNDGNYSPDNCRWATVRAQNNNSRHNRYITHDGVTLTLTEWSKRTGIHVTTLWNRIRAGRALLP